MEKQSNPQFNEIQDSLLSAVAEVPFTPDIISENELVKLNDNRMALWRTEEFKSALRKAIRHNLKKEKDHIPNKYASRVYRQLYFASVVNSKKFTKHQKIMMHPDCTKADYLYIQDKELNIDTNIKLSIGGVFTVFAFGALKSNLLIQMVKNLPVFVPLVGLVPITGMYLAKSLSEIQLNQNLKQIGLFEKYNLQSLQ